MFSPPPPKNSELQIENGKTEVPNIGLTLVIQTQWPTGLQVSF